MTLLAIKYTRGDLQILDQLKLPHESIYVPITSSEDGYFAILNMVVRGAPAIAIVAALSLAVELDGLRSTFGTYTPEGIKEFIDEALDYLNGSRPTAVNLADAVRKLGAVVEEEAKRDGATVESVVEVYVKRAEKMLEDDVQDNKNIGRFGAEWLMEAAGKKEGEKVNVLTHCNTG